MAFKRSTFLLKIFITLLFCFLVFKSASQNRNIENSQLKFGFNYGFGNQENFLFKSANYYYESNFFKIQINLRLKKKRNFELALNIEPSFYKNLFSPNEKAADKKKELENNEIKEIKEFGVNFGIQTKYEIIKSLYTYFLGSIGPTFFNSQTERLNNGMSFSDIIAIGINYNTNIALLDLRLSFRHVSNAGLNHPNKGYNSLNFEVGFTVPLK